MDDVHIIDLTNIGRVGAFNVEILKRFTAPRGFEVETFALAELEHAPRFIDLGKMLFYDRKMIRVDPTNMAFTAK